MSQYQLAATYGSVAAPAAGALAPYSGLYTDPHVVPGGAQGMVVNHGGLVSNYGGNVQNIQVSQSEDAPSTSWPAHILAERHRRVRLRLFWCPAQH
jgi:hypothetical protein